MPWMPVLVLAGVLAMGAGAGTVQFPYKGVAYVSWWAGEYSSGASGASLNNLRSTGANWGSVLVTWYMATGTSNTMAADANSTPTDADVRQAIRDMHTRGLKVLLKPHVDVKDGTWRGAIAPTHVSSWFSSYNTFITKYAQIAQQEGAEMFCAGCELKTLSGANYSRWNTVISNIRQAYSGPLTYAANASQIPDEYASVCFWGLLDLAGVDVYIPLTSSASPTVPQLVAAWFNNRQGMNFLAEMRSWNATVGKPVLFTEIGYQSADMTNETPWWTDGACDPQEQADCYEAAFEVWSQEAWLQGMFWWGWQVSAPPSGDTSFDPAYKPAQSILQNWYLPPLITARETQDANGNGCIDAIRLVTSAALNDSFAGLSITVAGYSVTGYDTGSGAGDNEFFVRLAEKGIPDTDARPGVQVVAGGSLGLSVDAAAVTPTDKAKPVLLSASWYDGSSAGVDANDPIYLTFSEPVSSNSALAADFGLPVANDSFGAGAAVSNGQNQQSPKMLTLTLQGDPLLTPGGLYSPGALTPGSPTGTYVVDGTRIVDAAGNAALNQTVGTAVDLQPGTESISVCWDNLSVTPQNWSIGASTVGATYRAYAAFPPNGLAVRNSGNVRAKLTVSCSGAAPSGWALASAAGLNQFEMKAAASGPPYTAYTLDLATGPKDVAGQLYSGHTKPFDLQLVLPTAVSGAAGVTQTITLTITATKD